MEFRIFGPLGVVHDGGELQAPTGKPRLLLATLLCHPNEPVPNERLVDVLWGAGPPKSAVDNLRVYVSQLRKLLGDSTRIVREPRGYALTVKPGELDADRFEELLSAARACDDPARAGTLLREALTLAQEPPFADVEHLGPIATTALRLDEQRATAASAAVEADLALGRNAQAIAELYGLIDTHPLREGLRRQLMIALYRSGRQAEALAAYQEARKVLVEELGIEPGPALRDLETRILNADPTLDLPPPAHRASAAIPPASPGVARGSWLWAAVPLLSCGYGTPWAFVYAAVKRRSFGLLLSALVYVVLCGVFLVMPLSDADGLNELDIIPVLALVTLWLGGTCHAVLVREHVFTPPAASVAELPRWKKVVRGAGLVLFALVAVAGFIWLEPPA
ncbi:AfsR/SARP family transcriptional regulator [Nonomuraea gerenzanensis]|uniref:Regulatory protein n=1 Tax=Nonomuraea gerenzanensis TaxID=93944 RepID=A0A1M4E4G5_9ACTN|nr:AfsR/SARP family transcriptional regulator [Nonomuraea gerenzanensis]UBU15890.1 AfsR/SARP family transcriptional regulator [Nonomuraea gerenzanensis]SBO93683.1 regulatory protein [Nonomuraea gerenzanensis]